MVNTVVIDVDKDIAEFIRHQSGVVDPSAFINQLLRQEMKREGFMMSANQSKGQESRQKDTQAMEDHIDQVIPAAG